MEQRIDACSKNVYHGFAERSDEMSPLITQIDDLSSKVESAIWKLKEYRSAVISAAVTGKIATTEHTEG